MPLQSALSELAKSKPGKNVLDQQHPPSSDSIAPTDDTRLVISDDREQQESFSDDNDEETHISFSRDETCTVKRRHLVTFCDEVDGRSREGKAKVLHGLLMSVSLLLCFSHYGHIILSIAGFVALVIGTYRVIRSKEELPSQREKVLLLNWLVFGTITALDTSSDLPETNSLMYPITKAIAYICLIFPSNLDIDNDLIEPVLSFMESRNGGPPIASAEST